MEIRRWLFVVRRFTAAICFCFIPLLTLKASTYYVSLTGSDSNAGSSNQPWRTIQKAANVMVAGDTVLVSPGRYAEYVRTRAHGTSNAPVHFRATPANVETNQVITAQFRVQHRFNVIEGFNLTGAQDINNAVIRIEFNPPNVDGSHTIVTNNTIRDAVYLMTDDLSFDSEQNGITTLKHNWITSGFTPGGYVFLGSNSKNPFVNHDTAWRVKSVTAHTIFLTNNAGAAFLPEATTNVWGVIYAGSGNDAFPGINVVLGSGVSAATNCIFVNNTFSNLFGCPIKFNGENHLVESNFITRLQGYYGIQPQGRNHMIRNNTWKDCTNFIFFTQDETRNLPHPEGGNFFDYQVAFISSFVPYSTNIIFEHNWIQNIHNQLGLISQGVGNYGFIMRSNVFVGVQSHLSGSRSGLVIENNTFYRCSFDEGRGHVLGIGGTAGTYQQDLLIRRNLFIDCGPHASLDFEGYYGVVDSIASVIDNNFVCGPETTGFAGKRTFAEPNGINGGDPILLDPTLPLGADGLPFTADDGLRPLANSPVAGLGWGALPQANVEEGTPIAHFRLLQPKGWFDPIGTNYNPRWGRLKPYERGDVLRPYYTPESVGTAPVMVAFSATNSIAGLAGQGLSNDGIVSYSWDFGDGKIEILTNPVVTHTFSSSGTFPVCLTVSNLIGNAATIKRSFRVLSATAVPAPLITNPRIDGKSATFEFSFPTVPGIIYQIELTEDLDAALPWQKFTTILGAGTTSSVAIPMGANQNRFCRIRVE